MLTLDPTKTGFDWGNARALAEASARAYTEPATVDDPFTDAQCLIEDHVNCISVAFKGSRSPRDFVQDAECWMTDYTSPWPSPQGGEGGKLPRVHHGFAEDWRAIRAAVVTKAGFILQSHALIPPKIFVTGHSLGGALAIECALEFQRAGFCVAGVYTFGCPRMGNAAFRDIYNAALLDKTFNVVNQNDIVPRTPPLLLGYKRAGQKVFLPCGGGWALNPPLWSLLLSDALGFWGAYRAGKDVLVTEHFIAAYQQRIQGLL